MLPDPQAIVDGLRILQRAIRNAVVDARERADNASIARTSSADTIYGIDDVIEPAMVRYLEIWSQSLPMVVIAEGLEPETGRAFPTGSDPSKAAVRIILDPIDGTRGLMFDKRSAWTLAGVAPNKGADTRLSDIEVAMMTELPTTKQWEGDVLWAVKGQGAKAVRENCIVRNKTAFEPLKLTRYAGDSITHAFATVFNPFPATRVLAGQLMDHIVDRLNADPTKSTIFDDQYISTGGQHYELAVGHDRFNADLRPVFFRMQGQPRHGLCCHPYDCAAALVATEAGVIITDERGGPLDAPLDTTSDLCWIGYANAKLRDKIEPLIQEFLRARGGLG